MPRRLGGITSLMYGNAAWYKEPEVNSLFASAKARGRAIRVIAQLDSQPISIASAQAAIMPTRTDGNFLPILMGHKQLNPKKRL